MTVADEGIARAPFAAQGSSWWQGKMCHAGDGRLLLAWKRAFQLLRPEESEYTPAGLRGGGPTDQNLRTNDAPRL